MNQSVVIGTVLLLLPATTRASDPQTSDVPKTERVSIGQRVRALSLGDKGHGVTGTLIAEDDAGLTLATPSGQWIVPRDHLQALEVSRGRGSRTKGALIGAAVGLGGLLLLGALAFQGDFSVDGTALLTSPATYVFAGSGAWIGARRASRERWSPAAFSGKAPTDRASESGLGFKVSLRF